MRAIEIAGVMLMGGTIHGAAAADSAPAPFSAHYQAEWRGIRVGVSDLELKPDGDGFVYLWRIGARGIFRLAYGRDVLQTSWFALEGRHVRPEKYRGEDGASLVSFEFDWNAHRARGVAEGKPLDLEIPDGTQDVMSIQIEVMQDLRNGSLPQRFDIVDKDEVKEFAYTDEGTARIKTALGPLDTLVVSSTRPGSNRVLRMWFAPALGMVPVQAERTRDGGPEFAMRIRSLKR
jgi:hypothetical protein